MSSIANISAQIIKVSRQLADARSSGDEELIEALEDQLDELEDQLEALDDGSMYPQGGWD